MKFGRVFVLLVPIVLGSMLALSALSVGTSSPPKAHADRETVVGASTAGRTWSAAYNAVGQASSGTELYTFGLHKSSDGRSSSVHIMNVSTDTANTIIEFLSVPDGTVACGEECSFAIAPNSVVNVEIEDIDALPADFSGWAIITSDQPLTAVVIERAEAVDGPDLTARTAAHGPGTMSDEVVPLILKNATGGTAAEANSMLQVQNLDSVVTATIDTNFQYVIPGASGFYGYGSWAPPKRLLTFPLRRALSAPDTLFIGTVSSDRAVAAMVRTDWDATAASAWFGRAQLGANNVVDYVVRDPRAECSVIGLYGEWDRDLFTPTVRVAFQSIEGTPEEFLELDVTLSNLTNSPTIMDLCDDPLFSTLSDGFEGSLHFFDGVVAAHALVETQGASSVAGFSGQLQDQSESRMYTPLLLTDWPLSVEGGVAGEAAERALISSRVVIHNPSTEPISVTFDYLPGPGSGSCEIGAGYSEGPHTVSANRSLIVPQSPGLGSGLPAGCRTAAAISATGEFLATVLLEGESFPGPVPLPSTPSSTREPVPATPTAAPQYRLFLPKLSAGASPGGESG